MAISEVRLKPSPVTETATGPIRNDRAVIQPAADRIFINAPDTAAMTVVHAIINAQRLRNGEIAADDINAVRPATAYCSDSSTVFCGNIAGVNRRPVSPAPVLGVRHPRVFCGKSVHDDARPDWRRFAVARCHHDKANTEAMQ